MHLHLRHPVILNTFAGKTFSSSKQCPSCFLWWTFQSEVPSSLHYPTQDSAFSFPSSQGFLSMKYYNCSIAAAHCLYSCHCQWVFPWIRSNCILSSLHNHQLLPPSALHHRLICAKDSSDRSYKMQTYSVLPSWLLLPDQTADSNRFQNTCLPCTICTLRTPTIHWHIQNNLAKLHRSYPKQRNLTFVKLESKVVELGNNR